MDKSDPLPGAGASEAARAILAAPYDPAPVLSPQGMAEIRRTIRDGYEPAIRRAVTTNNVRISDCEINGIPCLQAEPAEASVPWPILYCYGGGYVTGSPAEDLIIAAPLAARTGARVILPNYRLAPEHPWPAAPDDGFAVYRALAGQPFALAGESAGGNLAMVCLHRAQAADLAMPGAVALLSPWCDLSHAGDSIRANDGRDPSLGRAMVVAAAQFYAGAHDPTDPDISPVYAKWSEGLPPVVITTGTRDLLLSHAVRAAQVLRRAGASVDIRIWDELWHVFEFDDRLPEADLSIAEIAEFLTHHMSRNGPD